MFVCAFIRLRVCCWFVCGWFVSLFVCFSVTSVVSLSLVCLFVRLWKCLFVCLFFCSFVCLFVVVVPVGTLKLPWAHLGHPLGSLRPRLGTVGHALGTLWAPLDTPAATLTAPWTALDTAGATFGVPGAPLWNPLDTPWRPLLPSWKRVSKKLKKIIFLKHFMEPKWSINGAKKYSFCSIENSVPKMLKNRVFCSMFVVICHRVFMIF